MYTKSYYVANVISDIPNKEGCEVLWVKVNPRRLPRGFSALVLGVLYHPLSASKTTMLQYLPSSLELLETKYPNCGQIQTETETGAVSQYTLEELFHTQIVMTY